jgi:4-amino-4-deoxy-L-arabinose transferase-like glycosyltransferase
MTNESTTTKWNPVSLLIIFAAWAALQLGGLFSPGLLDDVDSVYIQIAREMLQRHDFVTPTIDGIRFFDKPPLMYWMAAGSMRVFGAHDWAARLPLALGVLALLLALYALGNRLFASVSPAEGTDRAGLYAALAMATSIGPYLYTRFYIPDILIALWMTLSVHLFLIALERIDEGRSALAPMLAFGAVMALDVLTKGFIGVVFSVGFAVLYLAFAQRLRLLAQLQVFPAMLVFAVIAAPWHILAALRNPAIAMPAGVGLPARAGWAWFYLYNEHVARFLQKRIPHDYGQTPVWLFWLLLLVWLIPWTAFLPAAASDAVRTLRARRDSALRLDSDVAAGLDFAYAQDAEARQREGAMALLLWPAIVLGFFTLSARQEYYHLPALPALALMTAGLLAAADAGREREVRQALRGSLWFLVPLGALLFVICGYLAVTAPVPRPGATLSDVLNNNPDMYNVSLGHVFDLTGQAMGFFRGPLMGVALCMLVLGPVSHWIRRRGQTFAANLLVAAAMSGVLMAAHEGLVRFYPTLGSKELAQTIEAQIKPGNAVAIDGELTTGSSLLFYISGNGSHVLLVNGHVNGPWFGSFWPDAPHIFMDDAGLEKMWGGTQHVFLLTYHADARTQELAPFGPVIALSASGGKTVLTNRKMQGNRAGF